MKSLTISKKITDRSTDSVNRYIGEISNISKPLTASEEVELFYKYYDGDLKAREELIVRNLRFVISVAKQFYNKNKSPMGDLINEGNYGLIKAVERFDVTYGNKFISYAVWWIRQTIMIYLFENSDSVRIPINKVNMLNKIKKAKRDLEQKLCRPPFSHEIVEVLEDDISADDIEGLEVMGEDSRSLDVEFKGIGSSGDGIALKDVLINNDGNIPDKKVIQNDASIDLNRLLDTISERSKKVLVHFYGLNGSNELQLDEIAEMLDLSKERIRQIKKDALVKLSRNKKDFMNHPYR